MTEQNEQQTVGVALGLADLALMANIIQVTSERGAIKANEMQTVGALYSKLVAFVNANAPKPEITDKVSGDAETTDEPHTPEEE
jgi:hypothetical protein